MPSFIDIFILILLIGLSAIFSGLTIGYSSLSHSDLKRKSKLGNLNARKILLVRENMNLLMATLLIGNVAVNTAIPLYLDSVINIISERHIISFLNNGQLSSLKLISASIITGAISTFLILIFGEIIPNAMIKKHAFKAGAFFYPLVKFIIFLFYPISYPISLCLDYFVGKEGITLFKKEELAEIIKEHQKDKNSSLDKDEERILVNALFFSDKIATDIMTEKDKVFMVEQKMKLNNELLSEIKKNGFTRIPVYKNSRNNIVGILFVKDLIGINIDDNLLVKNIMKKEKIVFVNNFEKLDNLLNRMSKKIHMAIINNKNGEFVGVLTLEDILEEILGHDIMDETDSFEDMKKK